MKNKGIEMAVLETGSMRALARILKVSQPMIVYYLYKQVPATKAIKINKLFPFIPLNRLRPDLWQ